MTWSPTLHAQLALANNPLLTCAACGREVCADMLYDVRPFPGLRASGETHQCDSCVSGHHREGRLTHEAFAVANGAPLDHIRRAAEQDDTRAKGRRP